MQNIHTQPNTMRETADIEGALAHQSSINNNT